MELDEIKPLLKERLDHPGSRTADTVDKATANASAGSIMTRIKTNLVVEMLVFVAALIAAVLVALFHASTVVYCFSAAIAVCSIIFFSYLLMLYRRIAFHEAGTDTVKMKLQHLVGIIADFIRLYRIISLAILPAVYFFGLITGYIDVANKGWTTGFHWSKGIIVYTFLFIIWSLLIYFVTSWYIRNLYGKYLSQLQDHLKDIENG